MSLVQLRKAELSTGHFGQRKEDTPTLCTEVKMFVIEMLLLKILTLTFCSINYFERLAVGQSFALFTSRV